MNVENVIETACVAFSTKRWDLLGERRHHPLVEYRHVAMTAAKELCSGNAPDGGMSYPEVAKAFRRKDHTTVMSAVKKVNRIPRLRKMCDRLEEKVVESIEAGRVFS